MEDNNGKIPHFINDPIINRLTAPENKLVRPKISYIRTGMNILLFLVVGFIVTCVVIVLLEKSIRISYGSFFHFFPVVLLLLLVLCLRQILIWLIRLYQRYAKSETRLRCCFTPSCSEYAILAIDKYGAIRGGYKAIRRLFRCHPPGGVDYP